MDIKRCCSRALIIAGKVCLKLILNGLLIAFCIVPVALSISSPFILWNGLAENKVEYTNLGDNDYIRDGAIDGTTNTTNFTLSEQNYSTNCKLREVTYRYTFTGITQKVCLISNASKSCQEDVMLTEYPYQIGLVVLGFFPHITLLLLTPLVQMFASRFLERLDNKKQMFCSYIVAFFIGMIFQPAYYYVYLEAPTNCCLSMSDVYTHLRIQLAAQILFFPVCLLTLHCKVYSERIKDAIKRIKKWLRHRFCPRGHKCNLANTLDRYYARADDDTLAIVIEPDQDLIVINLGIEDIPLSFKRDVNFVIARLWQEELVGQGRDARGLTHSTIDIVNIVKIENKGFAKNYFQRRKMLTELARKSQAGRIAPPQEFTVATQALVNRLPELRKNVDNNVNEYYLFHGTKRDNVESIEKTGFRVGKPGMLGKGIYFSDSPVKADQYSDRGESGCIIVSRVLLGDWVRLKRFIHGNKATSTPCKYCFGVAGNDCKPPKNRFDSLVYMQGLFPEYVIYEECLAYPEFVVYYRRVEEV